jgi:serine/threonine protein kinase
MSDSIIGKKLGDYQIRELLGKGGMARVYLGFDEHLERRAAVKVINNDIPAKEREEYFRRFQNEARAIARLDHPNIVRVYQFGAYEDVYYMAMVFVDGKDLRHVLRQAASTATTIPISETLSLLRQTASALDYAHSQGVIHRDVKPSNIMVTAQGQAILTDFGLALTSNEGTLGETFGSAHYIAPEQAVSSANAVPQSDLYSLGICAFEMLTGRVPFDDPSAMSVALKHVNTPPPTLGSINPNVPAAFEPVIARALEKDPTKRYASGAAFVQALQSTYESRMAHRILGSSANIRTPNRAAASWPDSTPKRPDTATTPPGDNVGIKGAGAAPAVRTTYHYGPASKPDLRKSDIKPPGAGVDAANKAANEAAYNMVGKPASRPNLKAGLGAQASDLTTAPEASNPAKSSPRIPGNPRSTLLDTDSRLGVPGLRRPAVLLAGAALIIALALGLTVAAVHDNATNGLATGTLRAQAAGTATGTAGDPLTSAVLPTGSLPGGTPGNAVGGTIAPDTTTNAIAGVATADTPGGLTQPIAGTPITAARTTTVLPTINPGAATPNPPNADTPISPTATGIPGVTPFYSVTAVTVPTRAKRSVLLIWDVYQLSFINNSDVFLSVKRISFVAAFKNETRQFAASQWTRPPDGNYSDLLRPSQCYQIGRFGQLLPPAFSPCTGTAAYWQPGNSGQFWINADGRPDAAFEVYFDTTRIATCPIAAGRCTVVLPDAT